MSDILGTNAAAAENPLLSIDTSFRSYLNAYTRSFKSHVVGGALDYAFDSDFAVRQKINGIQGWSRLAKAILSQDIAEEAKYLFSKVNQAGSLKFPEVYELAKECAERLELNLPIVFVREDMDRPIIYSIASDVIEPCIVLSTQLTELCDRDELKLLIGCECGRIQNKHSVYNMAFTYVDQSGKAFRPLERSYRQSIGGPLQYAIYEWAPLGDITADRAGMICCDKPERFAELMVSIYNKGYVDFFGRDGSSLDFERVMSEWKRIHITPARSIRITSGVSSPERRMLAAMEFSSCEVLYRWRQDLSSEGIHTVNGQVFDIRSNIIMGTAQAGEV